MLGSVAQSRETTIRTDEREKTRRQDSKRRQESLIEGKVEDAEDDNGNENKRGGKKTEKEINRTFRGERKKT